MKKPRIKCYCVACNSFLRSYDMASIPENIMFYCPMCKCMSKHPRQEIDTVPDYEEMARAYSAGCCADLDWN